MSTNKKTAVFGIYQNANQAEHAVDRLMAAGFRSDDISVLLPDNRSSKDFAHEKNTKAPEGAATGGVAGMGIGEVISSPSSPWQNPYAERLIGSIRRKCLDHVIVFGEGHLQRVLDAYANYYNSARTHLSLDKNAPRYRAIECHGSIHARPVLAGLHHHYARIK